jgi:hypothetical protein
MQFLIATHQIASKMPLAHTRSTRRLSFEGDLPKREKGEEGRAFARSLVLELLLGLFLHKFFLIMQISCFLQTLKHYLINSLIFVPKVCSCQ